MLQELRSTFSPDGIFFLVLATLSAGFGLAFFIAIQWRKIRQTEIQAALKHDMLERGMSAEEIRMVVEAGWQSVALAALGKAPEPIRAAPVQLQTQSRP